MSLDHVNKYLLHDRLPELFALGRMALPLFATVLAFNLARERTLENSVYRRVVTRLAVVAAVSELPFIALGGLGWGWWPLNILATLLVATLIMWLVELGGPLRKACALALFLAGGALVEFWWPGLAICLGAWSYFRRPNLWGLALWIAGILSLYVINGNWWSLGAVPILLLARHVDLPIPRLRWVFYAYYPSHLTLLWMLTKF